VTEGVSVFDGTGEGVGLDVWVGGGGVSVALGNIVGLGVGTVEVATSGDGVENIVGCMAGVEGVILEQPTKIKPTRKTQIIILFLIMHPHHNLFSVLIINIPLPCCFWKTLLELTNI
jgi:hypothetical protein